MPLAIDATSLHPSTRLALEALSWLQERIQPASILEIGCGNGMLSLTAHHMWGADILACDISPRAVADMTGNIEQFSPDAPIRVIQSDGLKHPDIRAHAPYALIIGNLLAQWHVAMARDIANCLAPGGHLLLSGIMLWQQEGLKEALSTININVIQEFAENEWLCYVAVTNPR